MKVLLIEDNPGDARLIREMLSESRDTQIELDVADRLSSGLDRLASGGFDLVLLDLSLPDSQGLEACIETHNQSPHVPIVVLTGLDDEKMAANTLQVGAEDYLVKGEVDGKLLLRSIQYAVERKQAEEQLQYSQLLSSLGKMTAGIAHEVNNPLGSILLYSELLLTSDLPLQAKKDLRVIHDESKRAAKVMTALLTYSRRLKPQMRRLNLNTVLKKALAMREYEQKVQNIAVSANLIEKSIHVNGDSSQLMQVFINILLNAEEALAEYNSGKIMISTRIEGSRVLVSMADNGIGIPQKMLKQVFFPFYTTKTVGDGTGLGLSTCYGIIATHSGLIYAENNDTGGTTVIVDLPLAKAKNNGTG
ncbi:sensor histidine kinase [Chloroflexota bacterium]